MKVQYITSACVLVEHGGKKVLCDPWLSDGIYYGSWFHYPPVRFTPEDFPDLDALYISHIHPDHMDPETLRHFPKTLPVFIHNYSEKFLLNGLRQLGFRHIQEVSHRETVPLGEDFTLEILAADNCDPRVCGRFFGCMLPVPYGKTVQLDSLAIFHGGGKTVVNSNDCPYGLARSVCNHILDRYRHVDFLMMGYSGAGEYPQCFDNLKGPERLQRADVKRKQFLQQAIDFIQHLQPSAFMPFGGQYTLGGRLAELNPYRGVPEMDEIPSAFDPLLRENHLAAEMVLLSPGEWYDVMTGRSSAPFIPPDPIERARYIEQVLAQKQFVYERGASEEGPCRADLTEKLQQAQARMWRYQEKYGYRSGWRLYLEAGQEHLYCIPFDGGSVEKAPKGTECSPFVRIALNYDLLQMILERRAHWNNAAIGSHLRFYRDPDQFERGIYHFLSYLHC